MRRTLSLVLALVMVLSMFPFSAFAAEELALQMGENTATLDGSDAGAVYTWTAEDTGTLTITMPDPNDEEKAANGWEYSVANSNVSESVKTYYSDGWDNELEDYGDVVCEQVMEVTKDDVITVKVNTLSDAETLEYTEGTVVFTAAFESAVGSESQPIDVLDNDTTDGPVITADITVPAGKTLYYNIAKIQNMILTVTGEGAFTVNYDEVSVAAVDGVVTIEGVSAASTNTPALVSVQNTGDAALNAQMKLTFPLGEYNNPEVIQELGSLTTTLESGDTDGYYYIWTAEEAGVLSFDINTPKAELVADIVLTNQASSESISMTEAGVETVFGEELTYTTVSMDVAAGEQILIAVSAIPVEGVYAAMTVESSCYFTAPAGTEDNPLLLNISEATEFQVSVPAGETVYCRNTGNVGDMIFTLTGGEASVVHDDVTYTTANGAVSFICTQESTNNPAWFIITNNTGAEVTYTVAFSAPLGSWDNPEALELDVATTATLKAGTNGYYYTWTAAEEGTFTVTVDAEAATNGWFYSINNTNGTTTDDHTNAPLDEEGNATDPVLSDSVTVHEGDEVIVTVNTYDASNANNAPAGSVTFTASFVAGEIGEEGGEGGEGGTDEPAGGVVASVSNAEVTTDGYVVEYTAATAGTLTVTAGTCSPGWRYKVFFPDGTESIYLTQYSAMFNADAYNHVGTAGDWKVVFYAYSSSAGDNVAGTVSFDVVFTPSEGGGEVVKTEYEVDYEQPLALGDNTLTLLDTAYTTIYAFEPAEMGVYTFTAPAGTIIGYWGAGSWLLTDPNSTTNTCEWTCTGVGQSAYIGVSGVDGEFNLNVAKTGEYNPIIYTEVEYVNKATLSQFELPATATLGSYVDTTDVHTPVLGEDGYYHLDSADGAILLIDLDRTGVDGPIKLSSKLQSDIPTMYMYTKEKLEDGTYIKYSIANAILAYEAVMDGNGYYPLTEDLILFYRDYATAQGIWSYNGVTGETPWMYCCRTVTGLESMGGGETTDPTDPTDPVEPTDPTDPVEPTLGSQENPIILTSLENIVENVGTMYYQCNFSGTLMTVSGASGFSVIYNGETTEDWWGDVQLNISSDSPRNPITFAIVGTGTYNVNFVYPEGHMENPAYLFMSYNYATVAEGETDGYYYNWTAPAAGTLTLKISAQDPDGNACGWSYVINNMSNSQYGDIQYGDAATTVSVAVAEGDQLQLVVNTNASEGTNPAGDVTVIASFECNEHIAGEYEDNNDGTHSQMCSACGAVLSTADHEYVDDVCVCGAAVAGSEANPLEIDWIWNQARTEATASVTVPAGKTIYYAIYNSGVELTIGGELYGTMNGSGWNPAVFSITNDTGADADYALELAYPVGNQQNPAELVMGENTATVAAGSQGYYYTWTAEADGTLTISMPEGDWQYAINNFGTGIYGETQWSDSDPVVSIATEEVSTGDVLQIIINTYDPANEFQAPAGSVTFTAAFAAGGSGETPEQPENVVMSEKVTAGEDSKYVYTYEAAEDGTLTITVGDGSTNWSSDVIYFVGLNTTTVGSASGSAEASYTADVTAGTKYRIRVWETSGAALAATPLTVAFTATGGNEGGEEPAGEVITSGTGVAATVEAPVIYTWTTEKAGTLTVTMGAATPGWAYTISNSVGDTIGLRQTGKTEMSADFELEAGQTYTFRATGYNPNTWDETSANITYTLTFVPSEEGGEVVKEEYLVDYDHALVVGDNTLTLLDTAVTTIYAFEPTEVGSYTFTAPEGAIVGYWGAGDWWLVDPENTTNSCEWECTGVGQSAYIGVSGVEGEFTLTVVKSGAGEEVEETEYVTYENVHTPSAEFITLTGDETLLSVNVEEAHTAVLGSDGYYHLDTADGPILYVDLVTDEFDFSAAWGGYGALTMRGSYEEDGVTYNYDFLTAMKAYNDVIASDALYPQLNGLYPLTIDLMRFVKGFGNLQGWFNTEMGLSPFAVINEGENVNADTAWMVLCRYEEPIVKFNFLGSNANLGNSLAMNFALAKANVSDWTGHYAEITRETETGEIKTTTIPVSGWTSSGAYYLIPYEGLAAKEMCDPITVTVYNAEGKAVSVTREESIAIYAVRTLELEQAKAASKQNKELMTALVDMLYYGEAAQVYFKYNTDNLPTDLLDDVQKAMATGNVTATDSRVKDAKCLGTNLNLENKILMTAVFSGVKEGMTAKYSFTNHDNKLIESDVAIDIQGNYAYVYVDTLAIADVSKMVTITIYNADGTPYSTVSESMESYIARSTGDLAVLCEAIMKFGTGAFNYFH